MALELEPAIDNSEVTDAAGRIVIDLPELVASEPKLIGYVSEELT